MFSNLAYNLDVVPDRSAYMFNRYEVYDTSFMYSNLALLKPCLKTGKLTKSSPCNKCVQFGGSKNNLMPSSVHSLTTAGVVCVFTPSTMYTTGLSGLRSGYAGTMISLMNFMN